MKNAKRIVLGFIGTIVLTSFILFALDAYSADQAASHLTVQTTSGLPDTATLTKETAMHTKEENLSIGTNERHMLYQPQVSEHSDYVPSESSKTDDDSSVTSKTDDRTPSASSGKSDTASEKQNSEKQKKSKKESQTKHLTFTTVTQDYFSDALFIGDSRTVGMMQSHLLPESSYYAKTGIGIGDILTERIVNEGGRMISIQEALRLHSFGKVYIMIGINDISRGDTDWFVEQYKNILAAIRQTQPDAVIYIEGNIPMSYGTQDLNGALNNRNLAKRNEASRTLADSKNIFYLDIDKIYADPNGNLKSDYTTDGLHVSCGYYPFWVDYLMQHAIVRESSTMPGRSLYDS